MECSLVRQPVSAFLCLRCSTTITPRPHTRKQQAARKIDIPLLLLLQQHIACMNSAIDNSAFHDKRVSCASCIARPRSANNGASGTSRPFSLVGLGKRCGGAARMGWGSVPNQDAFNQTRDLSKSIPKKLGCLDIIPRRQNDGCVLVTRSKVKRQRSCNLSFRSQNRLRPGISPRECS